MRWPRRKGDGINQNTRDMMTTNDKNTTRAAALTQPTGGQTQGNNGHSRKPADRCPAWWRDLPAEEKAVIRDLFSSIRGLKHGGTKPVAQAARKWERSIGCFIKFRLVGGASRAGGKLKLTQRRKNAEGGRIPVGKFRRAAETDPRDGGSAAGNGATASRSTSRSLPGVSPNQD